MNLPSREGLDGTRTGSFSEASNIEAEGSSSEGEEGEEGEEGHCLSEGALEPSPSSCSARGVYWEEATFALEEYMARG